VGKKKEKQARKAAELAVAEAAASIARPPVPAAPVPAAPARTPAAPAPSRSFGPLAAMAARIGGAELCYGEPVRTGERTVIPVARMSTAGGLGFGGDEGQGSEGGGGGGVLRATPVGYIEAGPDGVRFTRLERDLPPRAIVVVLAAALFGLLIGRGGATRPTLSLRARARRS
jgi:hypothetical protein